LSGGDAEHKLDIAWFQQALFTTGILAGMSFTALVLVLQAKSDFVPMSWGSSGNLYFLVLVCLLGSTSCSFVFASIMMTYLASGNVPEGTKFKAYDHYTYALYEFGFLALLFAIPLLFLPFDWVATAIVAGIEVVLFIFYHRLPDI